MNDDLDLGNGVTLRFVRWAPDRELNPQYDGIPDVEKYGAVLSHHHHVVAGDEPLLCEGYVTFDGDVQRRLDPTGRAMWKVESWDPLTLSPSIVSPCGLHGFVRGGRWVPA